MEQPTVSCFVEGGMEEERLGPLVGRSTKMQQVFDITHKLATSDATVLITGESGTGKELAARTVHNLSHRATGPFVPVNCGAIPEELLESELFGHVRGAFTGATNSRQGRFQLAHGGTLFLDEIGEMSPKLQVKLLRVLQEREFEPVGSDKSIRVDVRVIAATNRDLFTAVKERRFREDLFYRLNVLPIHLPPLRERIGDVALLIKYFLRMHGQKRGVEPIQIEDDALDLLERYRWPGNVREMENLIERLVILSEDSTIRVSDLPEYIEEELVASQHAHFSLRELRLPPSGVDLNGLMQTIEDQLILQALSRTGGNKTLAAELLHLNRTTLIERMRKKRIMGQGSVQPPIANWTPVRTMTPADHSLTA